MNTADGKGTLYYKFSNYKRKFQEVNNHGYGKKSKQANPIILDDNESIHIRRLKFDNLTIEQKFEHWRGCVSTRLNHIRTNGSNKQFFLDWPQYKMPTGHDFVSFFKCF